MRIKLLRSCTSEDAQLQVLTTFLVNDCLAIDGGSVGLALSLSEMQAIRNIVLSRAVRGDMFLKLLVKHSSTDHEFEFGLRDTETRIGRALEQNDLVLND